jgi:hypothetical protein
MRSAVCGPSAPRERGSAIVEASLTLSLFMVLTLSLVDFGLSLFLFQNLENQAHLAARYGAVHPGNTETIKKMVLYGRTTGSGNGILGLPPSAVTVTRKGTVGGVDDRIEVRITGYNFTLVTPGWSGTKAGIPITVTMPVEN